MSIDQLRDVRLITALITPFHEDGSINYDALPGLIEHLLAHHTEALLLAGTTAESPTLTHDEELELFAEVQKIVNGRVPLIAGVGTNDTRDSLSLLKKLLNLVVSQQVWLSYLTTTSHHKRECTNISKRLRMLLNCQLSSTTSLVVLLSKWLQIPCFV